MSINDRAINQLKFAVGKNFQAIDVNHAWALYIYATSGKFSEFSRLAIHTSYCGYVHRIGIRVVALGWRWPFCSGFPSIRGVLVADHNQTNVSWPWLHFYCAVSRLKPEVWDLVNILVGDDPARNVYIINQGKNSQHAPFNLFNQNNIDKRHTFKR